MLDGEYQYDMVRAGIGLYGTLVPGLEGRLSYAQCATLLYKACVNLAQETARRAKLGLAIAETAAGMGEHKKTAGTGHCHIKIAALFKTL